MEQFTGSERILFAISFLAFIDDYPNTTYLSLYIVIGIVVAALQSVAATRSMSWLEVYDAVAYWPFVLLKKILP